MKVETTSILPFDPVLDQQIMSFLKGLVGPGVLPPVQATQSPANPFITISTPMVGETVRMDVFFHS